MDCFFKFLRGRQNLDGREKKFCKKIRVEKFCLGCRALVWVLSEPQILIFAAVQLLFVLKVQGIVKPLKCRTLGASWHFKMLKTILWLSGVKLEMEILLQVI